jgi:hypothetical protein
MYTILLQNDKSLVATNRCTIHQREKLMDKLVFLVPKTYNDIDLTDFIIQMQYIDQGNEVQLEILSRDESSETRTDYMNYILPIDTKLTRFSGEITLKLTLSKVDMDAGKEYCLESGEYIISISPLSDYYHFVSDKLLDPITQKINELSARMQAVDKLATSYDENKADNIKLDSETSELYLTANGKAIGDKISINALGDAIADDTEDGLIKVIL